jgi:hypothetical protein
MKKVASDVEQRLGQVICKWFILRYEGGKRWRVSLEKKSQRISTRPKSYSVTLNRMIKMINFSLGLVFVKLPHHFRVWFAIWK